jgi:small subunit ribosomal protein S6e
MYIFPFLFFLPPPLGVVVRKYVIRRKIAPKKEGKKGYSKAPKIQRLVTPQTLQRKRHRLTLKKRRSEKQKTLAANYAKLLAKRQQERAEARFQLHQKRRNSSRKSESKDAKKA